MKKLVAVTVALLLLTTSAGVLAEVDVSSMPDAELHALIGAARNELAKRELAVAENTLLVDQGGITVYLTGKAEVEGTSLLLEAVMVNDSGKTAMLGINTASINGWVVFAGGIGDTPSGNRQKGVMMIDVSGAGITTLAEVQDLELVFNIIDSSTIDSLFVTDPIMIHF
jgi:hypothetical protein